METITTTTAQGPLLGAPLQRLLQIHDTNAAAFDEAVGEIQVLFGQRDSGLAGRIFCGDWAGMTLEARECLLEGYIGAEMATLLEQDPAPAGEPLADDDREGLLAGIVLRLVEIDQPGAIRFIEGTAALRALIGGPGSILSHPGPYARLFPRYWASWSRSERGRRLTRFVQSEIAAMFGRSSVVW